MEENKDLWQQWVENAHQWLQENGQELVVKGLIALGILIVFWILAAVTRRIVRRAVTSSRLQFTSLLQDFFLSIAGKAVLLVGLLVAVSQLGFNLGPVLAGIGVAGFIIGFAVKDSLSNFAAGVMLLVYRPYDVGDLVEVGDVTGKVKVMSLVATIIHTPDNAKIIVPNATIWGDVIKNITAEDTRRVDLVFGISYDDSIEDAERILREEVAAHGKVLEEPAPVIKVHNLGDSSVDFVVRPWCRTEDYWEVRWDPTRSIKLRFDREGISMPYPQRDVHLFQEGEPE